jgi:hypothetical protein
MFFSKEWKAELFVRESPHTRVKVYIATAVERASYKINLLMNGGSLSIFGEDLFIK